MPLCRKTAPMDEILAVIAGLGFPRPELERGSAKAMGCIGVAIGMVERLREPTAPQAAYSG